MLRVNSQTADSLKNSSLWVMDYRREVTPPLNPLQRCGWGWGNKGPEPERPGSAVPGGPQSSLSLAFQE